MSSGIMLCFAKKSILSELSYLSPTTWRQWDVAWTYFWYVMQLLPVSRYLNLWNLQINRMTSYIFSGLKCFGAFKIYQISASCLSILNKGILNMITYHSCFVLQMYYWHHFTGKSVSMVETVLKGPHLMCLQMKVLMGVVTRVTLPLLLNDDDFWQTRMQQRKKRKTKKDENSEI